MSSVGTPTTITTSAPGQKVTTQVLSLTRKTQERHEHKQRLPRPLKNVRPLPLPQLRQQRLPCLLRNVGPQLQTSCRCLLRNVGPQLQPSCRCLPRNAGLQPQLSCRMNRLAPHSPRRSKEPFRGDLLHLERLLQPGGADRLRNVPTDRLCQRREAASFYRHGRQSANLRAGPIRQQSTATPCIRPVLRQG